MKKECGELQNTLELDFFSNICSTARKGTTSLKQKYARANNTPFTNKAILKAIMNRKKLRNSFLKYKYQEN